MKRESDLIDVWFDSGAMPLAQWHYPFENNATFSKNYPADFIAEGVDQTRGWFYTLHAIAVMLNEIDPAKFPGIAYKNVISNGLVLDKNGEKMSKRLGNAVDPFEAIPKYGADAIRWYMVENANPWDNLKFDFAGVDETRRKFFGTLYNTYGFFALYANVDGFNYKEAEVPLNERPEIDRWIISLLNSLIKDVKSAYNEYEPTKAARAIQEFVDEHLSNWYVRLCRRRFWKGEYEQDKIAAYQTLYTCLETLSQLMSPVAPFFAEWLYKNLNDTTSKINAASVHLTDFPAINESAIDKALEERMQMAQDISSLVLSLRKKVNIKVRQPLQKIIVPVLSEDFKSQLTKVQDLILSEVNVKELEMITETEGIIKKKIKANFKMLGARLGAKMKDAANAITNFSQHQISELEKNGTILVTIGNEQVLINSNEVEISAEDIPGWQVANKGQLTVALDVNITENLENEGVAREIVNQIQKVRKESGFSVTDKIKVLLQENTLVKNSLTDYKSYICAEILANEFVLLEQIDSEITIEINDVQLKTIVQPIKQ
jgi:isoleucyl-tRNA synthetase